MINLVTDASPWIAYFKGEPCPFLELGMHAGLVEVPAMVKLELLANPLSPKERSQLEEFLSGVSTLEINDPHLERAARLKARLAAQNEYISARDAHILQCAVDRNAILISNDPLFRRLQNSTGVQVQVW